ncbi:ABC transporter ATP-binding protein [Paenibacillus sp.]|uniref:ABC transporter ATP-binding protein n=1 Tax=Paenibacillus sp. TaxID=58172 RepID=UPI002811DA0D|nr:ABC transporter ATP-binding protein [Paenibacillus sp.]
MRLRVEGLQYTYPGASEPTLRGIDLEAEEGEIIGILGASGAGKTTLQRTLIGLLPGYEGGVYAFGAEISSLGREYNERIGVAFEFPNFYQRLTATENLRFFRSLYRAPGPSVEALLASVGLAEDAGKRVSSFSKGMRMRLNFCRALVNDPALLFLDEPTSGLDPENARRMKDAILALKSRGKTVLLTTHNMALAEELCDRIAWLEGGRFRLFDSPASLKSGRGVRRVRVEFTDGGAVRRAEFDLASLGDDDGFAKLLRSGVILTMHTTEASLEDVLLEPSREGRRSS